MNAIDTDVAIIGAGTAGMSAYRAALEHTPRLLLIEYAGVRLDDSPAMRAWVERIAARPAVVRGLQSLA